MRRYVLFLILAVLAFSAPTYATIPSSQSQITASANGVSTQFSYPFVTDTTSDIALVLTNTSGTQTTIPQSQYTVTPNPKLQGNLWSVGGTVTYPLSGSPIASGNTLTIMRVLPLLQTTVLNNQGNFYPAAVETALDTGVMQSQQISARTGQIRGTWVSGTYYNYGDIVQDGVNGNNSGNFYLAAVGNNSSTWSTDLANGNWVIAVTKSLASTTPLPISISNGGTGQTTAAAALTALGGISLSANNTFTGTNTFNQSPTIPTPGVGDSSFKAASTAFVNGTALTLANGTTAVTQSSSDNSTKVATTAQVQAAITAGITTPKVPWTPVLSFGGSSSGITYSTQSGTYVQNGKLIVAEYTIILTSKGSATGGAVISGLPFTSNGTGSGYVSTYANMSGLTGAFTCYVTGNTIQMDVQTPSSVAGINNAQFTNTTTITGTAVYIAM